MFQTDANNFNQGKILIWNKTIYLILSLWPTHRPICSLNTLKGKTNKEIEVSRILRDHKQACARRAGKKSEIKAKRRSTERIESRSLKVRASDFVWFQSQIPSRYKAAQDEGSLKMRSPIGQGPIRMSTANYLKVKGVWIRKQFKGAICSKVSRLRIGSSVPKPWKSGCDFDERLTLNLERSSGLN